MFVDKLRIEVILICGHCLLFKLHCDAANSNQRLEVGVDDKNSWKINYQSLGEIEYELYLLAAKFHGSIIKLF